MPAMPSSVGLRVALAWTRSGLETNHECEFHVRVRVEEKRPETRTGNR